MNPDKNLIEKVLEKQLKQGASQYIDEAEVEIPKKESDSEELEAATIVINDLLTRNGYKFPDIEDFNKRINIIFNRKIDNNSTNKYLYINYFDKCDRKFSKHPNNTIEYNGTYIIKDKMFLTDFYYLPQIMDYVKEYPEISKIENNMNLQYEDKEGNSYTIETWEMLSKNDSDNYNLLKRRYFNEQLLVNRNKYLFNDNKASLAWLKFNDQYFIQSLVLEYGWLEDKELLSYVIDKAIAEDYNLDQFYKLFWNKSCGGVFKINSKIYLLLEQKIKSKQIRTYKLLEKISSFFDYINSKEGSFIFKNLSEEEKVKALCNLAYFSEQFKHELGNSNHKIMGKLRYYINEEGGTDIIISNKYFNLPQFKNWWEEAESDERYVGACIYDGACGRDNPY